MCTASFLLSCRSLDPLVLRLLSIPLLFRSSSCSSPLHLSSFTFPSLRFFSSCRFVAFRFVVSLTRFLSLLQYYRERLFRPQETSFRLSLPAPFAFFISSSSRTTPPTQTFAHGDLAHSRRRDGHHRHVPGRRRPFRRFSLPRDLLLSRLQSSAGALGH
jgi:hypothetical protein